MTITPMNWVSVGIALMMFALEPSRKAYDIVVFVCVGFMALVEVFSSRLSLLSL